MIERGPLALAGAVDGAGAKKVSVKEY